MATVTEYDAATLATTTNADTYDSGSFSPGSVGELLVVAVIAGGTSDPAVLTASGNGVSTFHRVDMVGFNGDLNETYLFVANQLTTGTSAMTVTFDCTGDTASGAIIQVCGVVGMSKTGSAAVRQSTSIANGTGGTTPEFVFPGNCLTGNVTIYAIGEISTGGLLTPTNWTEGAQSSFSTPTIGGAYGYRESGFTGTTVTWPGNETAHGGVFVELDTTSSATNASAENTTSTGTANPAAPSVKPTGGAVAVTGTAQQPAPSVKPTPGDTTAAATAQQPAARVAPSAATAAATAAALDATISTATATNAAAECATATGAASAPSTTVTTSAGEAAATGTANQPAASVTASAETATATGTAGQPTIQTGAAANAAAEAAPATGSAHPAAPAISTTGAPAAATAAAAQPAISVSVNAECATATGAASGAAGGVSVAPGSAAATAAGLAAAAHVQASAALALVIAAASDADGDVAASPNGQIGELSPVAAGQIVAPTERTAVGTMR